MTELTKNNLEIDEKTNNLSIQSHCNNIQVKKDIDLTDHKNNILVASNEEKRIEPKNKTQSASDEILPQQNKESDKIELLLPKPPKKTRKDRSEKQKATFDKCLARRKEQIALLRQLKMREQDLIKNQEESQLNNMVGDTVKLTMNTYIDKINELVTHY